MRNRLKPLQDHCDHRAVFALAYLRTTEAYRDAAATPGYFSDPAWVNAEDALFAAYYFRAFDAWAAGRDSAVPAAWRTTFAAASGRSVSGVGDLLLGMTAHITRDLPFVLAEMGLVGPDGRSHLADHERINQILNAVTTPLLAEEGARFDPRMSRGTSLYGLHPDDLVWVLAAWREEAWHNAERLVAARGTDGYEATARSIEDGADARARLLRSLLAEAPPLATPVDRDAWCAAHHGTGR